MIFRPLLNSLLLLLASASWLCAQTASDSPASTDSTPAKTAASTKKELKAKRPLAVTPEREAAVLNFVQRNHAELAGLLAHLKASQPAEYEQAIRDLFRTTERLASIHERDPLQSELELAAWTAQSRVQLLAAKLKMGAADDLQDQLRAALAAHSDARVALLKHERHKTADRLSKIEGDIQQLETDREKVIDRQLQSLLRAAAQGRSAKNFGKIPSKSAAKKANSAPVAAPANTP